MQFQPGEIAVAFEKGWNSYYERHLTFPFLCRISIQVDDIAMVFANESSSSIKTLNESDLMSLKDYAGWMRQWIERNAERNQEQKWMFEAWNGSTESIRGHKSSSWWCPCIVLNREKFPGNASFLESVPVADTGLVQELSSVTRYGKGGGLLDFHYEKELFKVDDIGFYTPKRMSYK